MVFGMIMEVLRSPEGNYPTARAALSALDRHGDLLRNHIASNAIGSPPCPFPVTPSKVSGMGKVQDWGEDSEGKVRRGRARGSVGGSGIEGEGEGEREEEVEVERERERAKGEQKGGREGEDAGRDCILLAWWIDVLVLERLLVLLLSHTNKELRSMAASALRSVLKQVPYER